MSNEPYVPTSSAEPGLTRRRWLFTGVAALAAMPVALSACSSAPASPTAAAKAAASPAAKAQTQAPGKSTVKSIRIATTNAAGTTALATTVMTEQGYDKKHGLEVDAKPFTQADGEIALLSGAIDISFFAPVSALKSSKEGTDIIMFAPNILQYISWIVPVATDAKSWSDMKGKKVATLQPITGSYQTTKMILHEFGISLDKDYTLVAASPQAAAGFLEKGDVQAAALGEPVASKLIASGKFKSLGFMNDVWREKNGTDLVMVAWAVHAKNLEQNREVMPSFRAALLEAHNYIQNTPTVIQELRQTWDLKTDAELKVCMERVPRFYPTAWDAKVVENIKYSMRQAISIGIAPEIPAEKIDKLVIV